MHLNGPLESRSGFVVIPAVRCRKEPLDAKELFKACPEMLEVLNIVVRPVEIPVSMIEVYVRSDKSAAFIQQLCDLTEFLTLNHADVFENALGNYDIKTLTPECDWAFDKVCLNEVWRWIVDGDIDSVIMDVVVEKLRQRRRPTTHIEKIALSSLRDSINKAAHLLHSEVRLGVFQVLFNPKISLVILDGCCRQWAPSPSVYVCGQFACNKMPA